MLEDDGFELVRGFVSEAELSVLQGRFSASIGSGDRSVLSDAAVCEFARSPRVMSLVVRHLGEEARPVRAILFDKTAESNWLVPWHQDLTIVVESRAEAPGYGPWSMKDGRHHVQPPMHVMERMLTIRLHLDDCDATNGALQSRRLRCNQRRASSDRWFASSRATRCEVHSRLPQSSQRDSLCCKSWRCAFDAAVASSCVE